MSDMEDKIDQSLSKIFDTMDKIDKTMRERDIAFKKQYAEIRALISASKDIRDEKVAGHT